MVEKPCVVQRVSRRGKLESSHNSRTGSNDLGGSCSELGLPLAQLPVRPNPSLPTCCAEQYFHRAHPDHRCLVDHDCFLSVLAETIPDEHALLPSTFLIGLTSNLSGFHGVFMVPKRSRLYPPCLAGDVIQVGATCRFQLNT